jgi:hypothetical protein
MTAGVPVLTTDFEVSMKTNIRWAWIPVLLLLAWCAPSLKAQQFSPTEDLNMTPEKTAELFKTHWTVLRDATEDFFRRIEKRGEFETSDEFVRRAEREKETYSAKVDAHIKETKINRRMFGVLLKATLQSYDANTGVYSVICVDNVNAPYDTPVLMCTIPSNAYVGMMDTTQGGYRNSKLYLKFDPDFKWSAPRKVAFAAKGDEGNIYFKLRFVLDISQHDITDKAYIRIIPIDLRLVNQGQHLQYWRQDLR